MDLKLFALVCLVVCGVTSFGVSSAHARVVHYELSATRTTVNLSGKKSVDFALQLNGSIPAPTLEFTEDDEAEIVVTNNIPGEELSVHWHGVLVPPEMDGVAYVTTPPIFSGESHTFRFPIRQSGTYWYHSHTDVQEQKGLYGAMVFHPKKKTLAYGREVVAVLSDWSDENATQILKNLRKDGDYYLYKKGTIRSLWGAVQAGGLGTYLDNEWSRMGGMDLSDVGYDAFLINGKRDSQISSAKPGERIRLRVINAAASTYFHLALGMDPMEVVSADGLDIQPVRAKEILLGMAETYDVLFTVPARGNVELRATAQDGTGFASAWIGSGDRVAAPTRPIPDAYGEHGGHSGHGGHHEHEGHHGSVVETLGVDNLRSLKATAFPSSSRVHDVKLVLGGDMERYVWHINGKAMFEDRNIVIHEGDVVRFEFQNETMMHHPMHLHGHFFRVLNKNEEFSPLKHTVDVPPHGTRTIEFLANEPGEWMLHCHNLYHMKTGMARVVKYSTFTPSAEIAAHQKHDHHQHDHWYFYGKAELTTNRFESLVRFSQTWSQWDARVESRNTASRAFAFDSKWEVEGDLFYRRWLHAYFNVLAGGMWFDNELSGAVGCSYLLPLLIESEVVLNHRGKFRVSAEKRIQWTQKFLTDAAIRWRPDLTGRPVEYEVSFMFKSAWSWAAGVVLTDNSLGAGVRIQF